MKKFVVPMVILVMLCLLGVAAVWDCVRLANDARHRVELADSEVQKHEERLIRLLQGFSQVSPTVQAAITEYESANDMQARNEAYEQIISGFRQTMSTDVDATNPLDRRFMDEVAGAINRRAVAEQSVETESGAYRHFLDSRRGHVARWFSATARADGKRLD